MADIRFVSPHLIVPGWGGSGPDHWQTYWEHDLAADRVVMDDWSMPLRAAWIDALDTALARLARRDPRPPVLIAHSLGCIAVAHWARMFRRSIRAALLVAPADVEEARALAPLRGFGPIPNQPLPFSSLVVASDDDPHITGPRAEQLATCWGSSFALIPGRGHINASSRLGSWPQGRRLLAQLLRRTDVVAASA